MRMVGTAALDMGRAPSASAGANAVALAGDLCVAAVQATGLLRHGAGALVRGVVAALRGPVVAALVTSLRTLPTPWVSVADPSRAHVPWLHTDAQPPRRCAPPGGPPANGHRELLLPADPTAPGVARAFLRCATEEWGVDDDLAQDAAMVITELVANAVDHAGTESTLAIGVLLGIIAVILIVEMKSLLIGEGASEPVLGRIVSRLESCDPVQRVIHIRTQYLGPDELLVAAKIALGPMMRIEEVAHAIDDAEQRVREAVPEARLIYLEPDLDRSAVRG